VIRDGGEGGGELVGKVDAGLKGGDEGAGKLHGITVKLLEVMAWLEKGRGELSMADRGCGGGPVKAVEQRKKKAIVGACGVKEVEEHPGACFKTRRGHDEW
jgi:hypothetical protein